MFARITGLAAIIAAVALAGCTTTQEANEALQSRWVGQPSDAFFSQFGPPATAFPLNDGGQVYTWRGGDTDRRIPAQYRMMTEQEKKNQASSPSTIINIALGGMSTGPSTYVPPGQVLVSPERTERLGCEAQIGVNASGIITSIRTTRDTDGAGFSFSRCAEVFGVTS
ncbi:MAG: hypothetical protein VYD57_06150 [Pseudomonadota bacterium]|nr:hypothetical protein [Pseudomonadota bacterium]